MAVLLADQLKTRSGEPMVWVATEHWMIPATQNYLRIAGLDHDSDGQHEVAAFKF